MYLAQLRKQTSKGRRPEVELYRNWGVSLFKLGRFKEASDKFEKAITTVTAKAITNDVSNFVVTARAEHIPNCRGGIAIVRVLPKIHRR